jgi:threonylcarbamoyladenosine tRNA methylthiotransferase MtaB
MIPAMADQVLIIDALSAGSGRRRSSRDSIGCGPRTIAGVFEKHHITCRIQRVERVISKPSTLRGFDHMAVSAMSMDLPSVRGVVAAWRRSRRRGRVIVGGPISSEPELLSQVQADLFVVGEGEETLSELILSGLFDGAADFSEVSGIAYRGPKGLVTNPTKPLLTSQELSEKYKPSTVRIVDYAAYQASKVYVEVVRGCSNFLRTSLPLADGRRCSSCGNCESEEAGVRMECPEEIPPGCGFCSVPSTWGPPRSRSADAIVSEIEDLVDLGVRRVALEAPGFLDYMRGAHPVTDPCFPPANIDAIAGLLREINALDAVRAGEVHISIENEGMSLQ